MTGFGRGGQRSSGSGGRGSSENREIDPSAFTTAQLIEHIRTHGIPLPQTTYVEAPTSPPVIRHSTTPQSSAARQVQPELPTPPATAGK